MTDETPNLAVHASAMFDTALLTAEAKSATQKIAPMAFNDVSSLPDGMAQVASGIVKSTEREI